MAEGGFWKSILPFLRKRMFESKRGVPQWYILGPLLFNFFINGIFIFIEKTEVCNFADNNTIYDCGEDLSNILENLKHDLKILLK